MDEKAQKNDVQICFIMKHNKEFDTSVLIVPFIHIRHNV